MLRVTGGYWRKGGIFPKCARMNKSFGGEVVLLVEEINMLATGFSSAFSQKTEEEVALESV